MIQRRTVLASILSMAPLVVMAQSQQSASEAALRTTVAQYFATWNRHDAQAWSEFLTNDVQWVVSNVVTQQTRESAVAYGAIRVKMYDVDFAISHIKLYDNDTRATVTVRGRNLELPVRDGKYARVWERDLLLSRWRLDGDKWRVYYWNDYVFGATALAKEEGIE